MSGLSDSSGLSRIHLDHRLTEADSASISTSMPAKHMDDFSGLMGDLTDSCPNSVLEQLAERY